MRIRWTEPAAHDLTRICDYIEEHDGPEAARKVALRIYEGIGRLIPFPYRGRPGRKKKYSRDGLSRTSFSRRLPRARGCY
jgi:plasmid stabilization system protein ParE